MAKPRPVDFDRTERLMIRGMSDPVFFSFDILPGAKKMLCHAVILTSFETPSGSDTEMPIGSFDNDPRGRLFIRYIWDNYLKDKKAKLDRLIAELEREIKERKTDLVEMNKKIAEIDALIEAEKKDTHE